MNVERVDRMLDALAHDVQLAFETLAIGGRRDRPGRGDEELLEHRLRGFRARAEGAVVARDLTPAEDGESFLRDNPLDQCFEAAAIAGISRQEHEAGAVRTSLRERE